MAGSETLIPVFTVQWEGSLRCRSCGLNVRNCDVPGLFCMYMYSTYASGPALSHPVRRLEIPGSMCKSSRFSAQVRRAGRWLQYFVFGGGIPKPCRPFEQKRLAVLLQTIRGSR